MCTMCHELKTLCRKGRGENGGGLYPLLAMKPKQMWLSDQALILVIQRDGVHITRWSTATQLKGIEDVARETDGTSMCMCKKVRLQAIQWISEGIHREVCARN
jgi:hypothetical protein